MVTVNEEVGSDTVLEEEKAVSKLVQQSLSSLAEIISEGGEEALIGGV